MPLPIDRLDIFAETVNFKSVNQRLFNTILPPRLGPRQNYIFARTENFELLRQSIGSRQVSEVFHDQNVLVIPIIFDESLIGKLSGFS